MTRYVFPFLIGLAVPFSLPAASPVFVQGVNLGGPATTMEGNPWLSHADAVSRGLTYAGGQTGSAVYSYSLVPTPDAATLSVLSSCVFATNVSNGSGFQLSQPLANGDYQIYLWTVENYKPNFRNMTVVLEGTTVASGIGDLPMANWAKYGPYNVRVADGRLDMGILRTSKGDPVVAGYAIYTADTGATTQPPQSSGTPTFYRGINLGGGAATVEGNPWLSYSSALGSGLTAANVSAWSGTYSFSPSPAPDAGTLAVLQSAVWRGGVPNGQGFSLNQAVPNGTYQVYVWAIENYISNFRNIDLRLEGVTAVSGIADLPLGAWKKYGPYTTTVSDGTLNIDVLRGTKGDPGLTGIAIYSLSGTTSVTGSGTGSSPPPSNQAPSVGVTSPVSGSTSTAPASVTLSASASDPDGSITKVEFFQGGNLLATVTTTPYAFQWNNVSAGSYSITARATDNSGAVTVSSAVSWQVVNGSTSVAGAISVLAAGARGDGSTDDTSIIQSVINSSPNGATIDFGSGRTYIVGRTIDFKPNRNYVGSSTLKNASYAPATGTVARLAYNASDNVIVDGLTFDASYLGAGLRISIDGAYDIPARNVTIRNCTFRNMRASGDIWEAGLYTHVGMQDSLITNNKFVNCGTCLYVANPNNLLISYNDFDTTDGGNAISIVNHAAPFTYGYGLEISHNTGRNFKRMAVEIYGAGGVYMESPVIANNTFTDWNAAAAGDPYGISVVTGRGVRILNNVISNGRTGYGVELGTSNAVVQGNKITGFPYGVVIQGQPDATVDGNEMTGQSEAAILFSNANNGQNPRAKVTNNIIRNARNFGIGMYPNDYTGANISGNTIERAGGAYGDDSGRWFIAIKLDAGNTGPITVSNNTISQTAAVPPGGFDFSPIAMFGGRPGSVFDGNRLESRSSNRLFTGLLLWYYPFLNGSTVSNNQFIGLNRVTGGYTSSQVSAPGNTMCRVNTTDPFLISGTYCPY